MKEKLIITIDYERAWRKTLLCKLGKKYPSQAWKIQYKRIFERKYGVNKYLS